MFGCPQADDMQAVFDGVSACDLLVLATPIYSWYCTPPMDEEKARQAAAFARRLNETI